jgi:hypothetical protein
MAVTAKMYRKALKHFAQGDINWGTANVKVALMNGSFTYSAGNEFWSEISANQLTGATGYTPTGVGGVVLQGTKSIVDDATANNCQWLKTSADFVLPTSTITCKTVVLLVDTGTAATSPLLGYGTNDTDVVSSNGDWKITWDTSGIFKLATTA